MATSFSHETTLFAEPIISIGSFTITNSLLTAWIAVLVIVCISFVIRRSVKKVPGTFQGIFEVLLEQALSLADLVTNSRTLSLKIIPIAFSIFVFVLVNNLLGFFPGVGSIGFIQEHGGHDVLVPLFRGGTADVNTTLALGLISVLGANIFGAIAIGTWKTINKYININVLLSIPKKIKKEPTVLILAPIHFFVGIFEIVGEIGKVASLSFRLFGNIFAGEVLLMSMSLLVAYAVPIPFLFLEVFVGFIQALIFGLLTIVYFTIAASSHDDHDTHKDEHTEVTPQAV